jgi:FkbM family methyltransferase
VPRRQFDIVEVLSITVFVACSVALLVYFSPARTTAVRVVSNTDELLSEEARRIAAAYGPDKYSAGPEEWILRELLHDQREGVFLDIGSADARVLSNTYYFESVLGWSGIAVDAQTEYAPSYERFRPRTRFRSFLISDKSDEVLPFYITDEKGTSSANRGWAHGSTPGKDVKTVSVSSITLDDLLAREQVSHIDLMSMDIEGHEPQALAGFSIDRFRPRVVVIEAHLDVRQALLDYFTAHGYVVQGRYLWVDNANLYFTPLAKPPASR